MNEKLKGDSAQLEKRLAALSQDQKALFLRRVKQKAGDLSQIDTISVQRDRTRFPLSFSQKQLWFLSQLEPESTAYNVPLSIRLKGPLNISTIEQAFTLLIQRQDILRTTFLFDENGEDDEPFQVVTPFLKLTLPLIDLQCLFTSEGEQVAEHLIRSVLQQPFDLAEGPLVRLLLLRIQPEDHVLLLCMHHIICDGRSLQIAIHELLTAYTTLMKGEPVTLPELSIQYRDYAAWQQKYLQGKTLEQLLQYWTEHLNGTHFLKLPYDYPHTVDLPGYADKVNFELFHQTLIIMRSLCREENVTLFMLLLACFQVLLWCQTQQEDIIVGVSMNNRQQPETNDLIGLFVNMLPLKTHLCGQSAFRKILQKVRVTCIDGYDNQDIPFVSLVQALSLKRVNSYVPLIQVAFDFQRSVAPSEEYPLVQMESFSDVSAEHASFDLQLRVSETSESIQGVLEYNCSLFKKTTIIQMAQQFSQLVSELVQSPDITLHEIRSILD